MTDKLEGDKYITLHFVWETFLDIDDILKESDEDGICEIDGIYSIINEMKKLGRSYCLKNLNDMMPSFEHKTMTFLTPHYKKLGFLTRKDRTELHNKIEKYLDTHFPGNDENQNVSMHQNIQEKTTTNPPSNFQLKIFAFKLY